VQGRRAAREGEDPKEIVFATKPRLGVDLAVRAAGWKVRRAPVLGDCAYGDNTELRDKLHRNGLEYVSSVSPDTTVFCAATQFIAPQPRGGPGRHSSHPRPDRDPESIRQLIARLGESELQTVAFGDGPDGKPLESRFVFVRVGAAHHRRAHDGRGRWGNSEEIPPREERLIAEWPKDQPAPIDYWISNLPRSTQPERLARLARLRWKIELDYKQLKGELGLDHYEGRSWLG